jgi:hypothetical protein
MARARCVYVAFDEDELLVQLPQIDSIARRSGLRRTRRRSSSVRFVSSSCLKTWANGADSGCQAIGRGRWTWRCAGEARVVPVPLIWKAQGIS